jgi:hypothetical protein
MDTDLVITVGIVLLVLSVPSLLSAWVDGRVPRLGAIMSMVALGMIITASFEKPGGYAPNQVPEVIIGVIARLFQ